MFDSLSTTGVRIPSMASPTLQSDWLSAVGRPGEVDMIHRTITSTTAVIRGISFPTALVASKLDAWRLNLQADVDALKIVTKFQRKYINYQATYNAFLLGSLTEEEFDLESDAYISEERKVEPAVLAPLVARLGRLLEFPLTDRELGEYLEVDYESMVAAIQALAAAPVDDHLDAIDSQASLFPMLK